MRFVVVIKERCRPDKCGLECIKYCPVARAGKEIIKIEGKFAVVDESLCIGCGICVHKCPFGAIKIVNKPEELGDVLHRFMPNGFAIFGEVEPAGSLGFLGRNGTGKTTLLKILAGKLIPNFGESREISKEEVLDRIKNKKFREFLEKVYSGALKISFKPQMVSKLTEVFNGQVKELLKAVDEKGVARELAERLELENLLNRKLKDLSGGELQRVAIAAALSRDAELYILDEPSSYLDIGHRIAVAEVIREYAKNRIVVEHDLLVLDYLVDELHIIYGTPAVYGIISMKKATRSGINEYLEGFLKAENMVIRDRPLKFRRSQQVVALPTGEACIENTGIKVKRGNFSLEVLPFKVFSGTVVGVLGKNGLGKTTFAEVLAGRLKEYEGEIKKPEEVSLKPQYVEALRKEIKVRELFAALGKKGEILSALEILPLMERKLNELSGGELQRVAIAAALSRDAELYILDEPSAFLDVEQRIAIAKLLRKFAETTGKALLVIDHDLMLLDYIADEILLFTGTPGKAGRAELYQAKKEAIRKFLMDIDVTLRRDHDTGRLRINKKGSQKDVALRTSGKWVED